jgi:hypothetical protein
VRELSGDALLLDLTKIDPLTIGVRDTSIYFSGTENGPYGLRCFGQNGSCEPVTPIVDDTKIELKEEVTAKRVARAFMHIAILCGGAKAVSPF